VIHLPKSGVEKKIVSRYELKFVKFTPKNIEDTHFISHAKYNLRVMVLTFGMLSGKILKFRKIPKKKFLNPDFWI